MRNATGDEKQRLLIACKDINYANTLQKSLLRLDLTIERCHDMAGFLRCVSRRSAQALVLDLALGVEGDIDLVSFVKQRDPITRMILLYDSDQIEQALDGIRLGAFFYLPKTSRPSDVALAVEKALAGRNKETRLDAYEQNVFEELVGRTDAMRRVIELIRKVAPTDSTVLLLGESGTGKEVVAHTLHHLSRRRDKAFVAVNCAALPDALLESELFGHARGAFTGAEKDKQGLFEAADGGTIFLDEIGDMAAITQAKVLRVLQSGEIRRVGSTAPRRVDVRVIAATHRDLTEAVRRLEFREDLYYRLNVIQIRIPPLRERMDALPALLAHFIARCNVRYGKGVRGVSDEAGSYLRRYSYPGNVRELESIIAHAVIMAEEDWIRPQDLPEQTRRDIAARPALTYQEDTTILSLSEMEAQHILRALKVLKGNQSKAAKQLGISRSTLWRKMREYGIPSDTGMTGPDAQ